MDMRVNDMEIQLHTNTKLLFGLLCYLISFVSLSSRILAEENTELALNDITEDTPTISHFSRAAKYAQFGYSASLNGQWHQARDGWEKAVEHLDLTEASDRNRAVFYYEFGHAAGITCDFEVAEEFLEKSYQLEKQINGPYVLTLVEMFRLYFDQKFYKLASIYFEAALPNLKAANAEENTPARYTRLLDEYADTLSQLDKHQLANQIKQQSRRIRIRVGKISEQDHRPIYGSRCGDSVKKMPMTIAQTAHVSNRMSNIREILRTMNSLTK
jgi:tetratricopeptide (TPR) repeat protein